MHTPVGFFDELANASRAPQIGQPQPPDERGLTAPKAAPVRKGDGPVIDQAAGVEEEAAGAGTGHKCRKGRHASPPGTARRHGF
jgi:hypothetical protein